MAEMKALLERCEPDLDSVNCLFSRVQDQVTRIEIYRDETECALRNHIMELENLFEDQDSCTETKRMKAAFKFEGEKVEILKNEAKVKNLQLKGEIETLQSQLESQVTKSERCHFLEAKIQVLELDVSSLKARLNEILQEKELISQIASAHFARLLLIQQGLSEAQRTIQDRALEIVEVACACTEIAVLLQADTVKPLIEVTTCSDSESEESSSRKEFSVGIGSKGERQATIMEFESSSSLLAERLQRTVEQLSDSQRQVQELTLQIQLIEDRLSTERANSIDRQNIILADSETRTFALKKELLEQVESLNRTLQKASDSLIASERRCCDFEIQIQDLQQKLYLCTEQKMKMEKFQDSLLAENKAIKHTVQTLSDALKNSEAKKGELIANIKVLQLEEESFKALSEQSRHKAETKIKALQESISRKEAALEETTLRCAILDSEEKVRQTDVEQLQKQCADFHGLIEKKDKELESLRHDFISCRASALESERSAGELSNLRDEKIARLQETAQELLDSEVQKFREKIKCLEDELCEKLIIISDQAEALNMKNTRIQEQEMVLKKNSELLAIAKYQSELLEKSIAAYRAELSQEDKRSCDTNSKSNLRRQLMHDVEQLRQCALASSSSKPETHIPKFEDDMSLDPSVLALRHVLKPIGNIIGDLILNFTATKKLAAERTRELRELEAEHARLIQEQPGHLKVDHKKDSRKQQALHYLPSQKQLDSCNSVSEWRANDSAIFFSPTRT